MNPRTVTDADVTDHPGMRRVVMQPPPGMDNCESAEVLIGNGLVRMPWRPDEIEVAQLAHGGTIWLTIWGEGMPPVALGVDE